MQSSPTTAAIVAECDQLGYAIVPAAMDSAARARMLAASLDLLGSEITRGRDRGADGKDGFRGVLALNPTAFLPLIASPRVLPAVVALLSPNIHVLSSHLIALPSIPDGHPRSIRTPQRPGWHRDLYGVTADIGTASTPRFAVKCAYYLTDITADSGLTTFLPGSHLIPEPVKIPPGQIDPPGARTPALNPDGTDAVLFDNRIWHAGGLNSSGSPRIALMIQYGYRWLAPVDDPAPGLAELPGLTDVQQQLLGAPDRNRDGSVAKGRGAEPLRLLARVDVSGSPPHARA